MGKIQDITPAQQKELDRAGKDKRFNFHVYQCLACEDRPEFEEHRTFVNHMIAVHQVAKQSKVTRQMGMHLDGTKFSETHYTCHIVGTELTYAELERCERTGEDAAWWMDI